MNVHKSAKNLHVYRTMNGSTHCGKKSLIGSKWASMRYFQNSFLHSQNYSICRIETQISSINQVNLE